MKLLTKTAAILSPAEAEKLLVLFDSVWPPLKTGNRLNRANAMQLKWQAQRSTSSYIQLHGNIIAHARIFPHSITHGGDALEIAALASVCVREDFQGQGLGRRIFRAIVESCEADEYPVALFQTAVPAFYEKLGARIVTNRFINSSNPDQPQQSPWWDPYVMIYPALHAWPPASVVIDLNGPGY